MWLSFKESSTASYENRVASQENFPSVFDRLIVWGVVNSVGAGVICDFTEVDDVASCVAGCVQASNCYGTKLKNLLVFDRHGARRDIILRSTYDLLARFSKLYISTWVIVVFMSSQDVCEIFTLLAHVLVNFLRLRAVNYEWGLVMLNVKAEVIL